jgi:site-specific DNA-methyltransferase (adenine-specific)
MEGMKRYLDKYFELAIVDPPYGIGNFSPTGGSKGTACRGKEWNIQWNDNIPPKEYFDELARVARKRIIWGANYYNCFDNGNGAVIWHKGSINPVFSQCEIASVSGQQKIDYYFQNWQGGGNWAGENIHPCQKPVRLYEWLLKNYAKPGYKILDTHLGSGSIAIACYNLDFDLTGFEIDEEYYKTAVNRLEQHKKQQRLFEAEIVDK